MLDYVCMTDGVPPEASIRFCSLRSVRQTLGVLSMTVQGTRENRQHQGQGGGEMVQVAEPLRLWLP